MDGSFEVGEGEGSLDTVGTLAPSYPTDAGLAIIQDVQDYIEAKAKALEGTPLHWTRGYLSALADDVGLVTGGQLPPPSAPVVPLRARS